MYVHVTTTKDKRDQEFERKKRWYAYERAWNKKEKAKM